MTNLVKNNFLSEERISTLLKSFRERADKYDETGSFVHENYTELKELQLFSGLVPVELGGLGMSYTDMSELISRIAKACASTALAFSMHQHLVSASVWKYIHKGVGAELLKRVAEEQLVLVSTGARDWLGSNGEMKRVEGGYLVTAKKFFASQSVVGDIAITSAPFHNEQGEWEVLHFGVPLQAKGVSLVNDWNVMGMRGTGSQGISFDDVFIPEASIALRRAQNEFAPVWNVVLTVAMPLIMSAYVGITERAFDISLAKLKENGNMKEHQRTQLGQLYNKVMVAKSLCKSMVERCADFDFKIDVDNSNFILSLKTELSDYCKEAVSLAMELMGGSSFYRKNELERLFRDVQASGFHPLPKWDQYAFSADKLLQAD